MKADDITIEALEVRFSICKVSDYTGVSIEQPFVFTGCTDEEKSLVCPEEMVPENVIERDDGWQAFRIRGQLDFSLTGILAGIAGVLADKKIGIFAVSTFNTDYMLVKAYNMDKALGELRDAGYIVGRYYI